MTGASETLRNDPAKLEQLIGVVKGLSRASARRCHLARRPRIALRARAAGIERA